MKKLEPKTEIEKLRYGVWAANQPEPIDTCEAESTNHARKIFEVIHDKKFQRPVFIVAAYPEYSWSDREPVIISPSDGAALA